MIRHMSLATTFRSLKQALSFPRQKKYYDGKNKNRYVEKNYFYMGQILICVSLHRAIYDIKPPSKHVPIFSHP